MANKNSQQPLSIRSGMMRYVAAERLLKEADMTPWKRFLRAVETSVYVCSCQHTWIWAAREILRLNEIDEHKFCSALKVPLIQGLQKGKHSMPCLAGRRGNEGKSWLLKPLDDFFSTFRAFRKSSCPLALPDAQAVVLDDF